MVHYYHLAFFHQTDRSSQHCGTEGQDFSWGEEVSRVVTCDSVDGSGGRGESGKLNSDVLTGSATESARRVTTRSEDEETVGGLPSRPAFGSSVKCVACVEGSSLPADSHDDVQCSSTCLPSQQHTVASYGYSS